MSLISRTAGTFFVVIAGIGLAGSIVVGGHPAEAGQNARPASKPKPAPVGSMHQGAMNAIRNIRASAGPSSSQSTGKRLRHPSRIIAPQGLLTGSQAAP